MELCSFQECGKPKRKTGLCEAHYMQRRRGHKLTPIRIYSTPEDQFWSKVDKSGACWNWTGATTHGYGRFRASGRTLAAHRIAFQEACGQIPKGMHLDHTCHNTRCVNPGHLRIVTNKQNIENRGRLNSNNSSGVRGVHWRKDVKKWEARATHGGKVYIAGTFADLADAESAAVSIRNELFTHNDLDRKPA